MKRIVAKKLGLWFMCSALAEILFVGQGLVQANAIEPTEKLDLMLIVNDGWTI